MLLYARKDDVMQGWDTSKCFVCADGADRMDVMPLGKCVPYQRQMAETNVVYQSLWVITSFWVRYSDDHKVQTWSMVLFDYGTPSDGKSIKCDVGERGHSDDLTFWKERRFRHGDICRNAHPPARFRG